MFSGSNSTTNESNFKIVCNCIHELLKVFEDSAQHEHTILLLLLLHTHNTLTKSRARVYSGVLRVLRGNAGGRNVSSHGNGGRHLMRQY